MLFHTSIINVTTGVRGQTKRDDNANRFLDAIRRRNLTLNDEKALSSGREFCILGYCMGHWRFNSNPEILRPLQSFLRQTFGR